jgi:sugar lactone lactonase YvrE
VTEETGPPGYWPSRWPAEDGGPARRQAPASGPGLGIRPGERLEVTAKRDVAAATMTVLRDPGEAYLLRHTGGADAISWVERIDPESLEPVERSPDLPGGPTWPGGVAVHANGSLYVAFGNHAHRLAPDTSLLASRTLPRVRPYNSFVVLPDGHLVTKDFGGVLPGGTDPAPEPTELLVLEPEALEIVARRELPERSIARLSADGDDVYVVGEESLFRLRWDGRALGRPDLRARYRTIQGQTYGWDTVIDAGAAWFLDNGAGSERYAGTFRGQGISTAPLHLVRVDLRDGSVQLAEICGLPNGVVANPPSVDPARGIAVGFDSGNGVLAAFDVDPGTEQGRTMTPRWSRQQDHACHMIRFPDTGELVTADHDRERMADQIVVLDIETGDELGRVDTGGPVQSVVFPAAGFDRDLYVCSFTTLSRVRVV